tara:strand:+ start:1318 stop:1674 length:357 start_codon:yes stop_codon:yes gene_type:complete
MALTIRKRKTNKAIKIPGFDLEKLVNQSISSLIVGVLGLRNDRLIRYVEYFPVYTICEVTKDKSIGCFFLRTRFDPTYKRIPIKHIELSGATIVEFIDFLEVSGATMNSSPVNQLETL